MPLRTGLAGAMALGMAAFAAGSMAEPPKDTLRQALEASVQRTSDRLIGEAQFGELDDAGEVVLTFDVDPAKIYKLYSVCDADCTELSVSADDANGDFIDNSSNTTPILEIEDFKGRSISVEVFMMNCKKEPCAFAVSLAEAPESRLRQSLRLADVLIGTPGALDPTIRRDVTDAELVDQLRARVPDNFALVGEIGRGRLGSGEAMRYFFEVEPGAIYDVFAGCDCADLNLVARDGDDQALASDLASDNSPIIELTRDSWPAERRGGRQKLVVEVKMKDCGGANCGFAAGLYRAN
jgi:hypothetical protein